MKKNTKNNNQAIDAQELFLAMNDLEKEKGINKEYLLDSIQTALITAYKRNFDADENVSIVIDEATGEVVEEVEIPQTQISLEEAKKINKKLEIGDKTKIEIIPRNFGRIAAQTAKQVIIQKIREASRDVLYTEFNNRKGEIVSGIIQKADGGIVVLDLGKLEGVMPLKEQVPTEKYRVNDKIRAYVLRKRIKRFSTSNGFKGTCGLCKKII